MKFILRILFVSLFLLPSLLWAQDATFVPRSKIIRDRSFLWLNDDSRQFRSKVDSLNYIQAMLGADTTKYESMEAALLDINDLLNKVENNETVLKNKNEGLSYRISSMASQNREKAKVADDAYLELLKKSDATVEDFILLKKKFGDRPTYYVNDVEVGQDMLNRIRESYILNRDIRVSNTLSGNPNGEIWIDITPKAASRLKLNEYVYNESSNTPSIDQQVKEIKAEEYKPVTREKEEKERPSKSEAAKEKAKKEEAVKPAEKKQEEIKNDETDEATPKRSVRRVKKNIQDKK